MNLVGLFGVQQGTTGDLLVGLPTQMTEMHPPVPRGGPNGGQSWDLSKIEARRAGLVGLNSLSLYRLCLHRPLASHTRGWS